jgi:hypothetical protein
MVDGHTGEYYHQNAGHHAPGVTSMLVVRAIWLVQAYVPWQQLPQPFLM